MSSEGNLKHPVCSSGRIQDVRETVAENFNCVQLKGDTSYSLLSRVHDDLRNTSGSEIAPGVVDLSGFNLCSSSNLQIEHSDQLRANNVEDWLRLTTDVNLEEYGFIKSEVGNQFSPGVIAHDFETAKSNDVDMCINNECDTELNLQTPENNSECDKNKFSNLSEFLYRASDSCNGALLNSFTESDSFLNYLEKNDILGKDILLENVTSAEANKLSESSTGNFDTASSNVEYSLTDMCPSLEKPSEESDIQITQSSLGIDKESTPWEQLYINKHSDESVREIDYPEFNLLTFHVELCDNLSSQDDVGVNKIVQADPKSDVEDKLEQEKTLDNPEVATKTKVVENESPKNLEVTKSPICILKTKSKLPVPNPRSILKSAQSLKNDAKVCSSLKSSVNSKCVGQNNIPRTETGKSGQVKPDTKGMAFVAISTDKCKNTTEIVINTARGEQVLKGKTSDLMKATSNLWVKVEKISSNSAGQTLTISTVKEDVKQPPSSREKFVSKSRKNGVCLVVGKDRCINFQENSGNEEVAVAEEKPTLDALREHGLPMEYTPCIVSDTKYWLCPIDDCRRMYPRKSMVHIHVLSHYGIRPFRCDVHGCQWSFYSYFKLKRHKETHLKKKDFHCEKPGCGKKFTTIYNLNAHQKLHCRPAKIVCTVENCGASFQTKRSLEQHMKSHDIEYAPYRCPYKGCTKRYYSSNTLTSHMRCHQHKEEELRCQWDGCGKLFDKPCRLRAHMRSHNGDKPYLCNFAGCSGAFQTASKLKRHQLKHSNLRRYCCTVEGCSKSFYRSEHMKEHALTHVGLRIFKCPVESCSVTFTARSSLYVHMKKHENKAAPGTSSQVFYHCPVDHCEELYSSRVGLRQHMFKSHVLRPSGSEDLGNTEGSQLFGEATQLSGTAVSPNSSGCVLQSASVSNRGGTDVQVSQEVTPQLGASNFIVIPHSDHQPQTEEGTIYADVCTATDNVQEDSTCRSARTHITFSDIVHEKKRNVFGTDTPTSLKFENDVVLGSSALANIPEPAASFMVQEDLPITHYYYQDEQEFQILLLDPLGSPQEFAESTINLRDLE